MAESSYRPLPGPFIALTSLWAFSLTGLVTAVLVLYMEQEAAYNCSSVLANVCQASWLTSALPIFDCDLLSRSPLARPFGTPLTLYAACYYLVSLGLTIALVLSRPRSALWNAIEWVIGCFGIVVFGVTIGLLGYSIIEFHAICRVCLVFYFFNGGLCAATGLLVGPRKRRRRRLGELPLYDELSRWADRFLALIVAVLALSVAAVVATSVYRNWDKGLRANAGSKCRQYDLPNASTPLRLGSPSNEHADVLFIDPACSVCKREWAELRKDTKTALEIYLWPQDSSCDPEGSLALSLPDSQKYRSCDASEALWCVAKIRSDLWPTYLDQLYELQDQQVTDEMLLDAARRIAFSDEEVARLDSCARAPATREAILMHRRLGEQWLGVTGTPWRGVRRGEQVQELPRDPEARTHARRRLQRKEKT